MSRRVRWSLVAALFTGVVVLGYVVGGSSFAFMFAAVACVVVMGGSLVWGPAKPDVWRHV